MCILAGRYDNPIPTRFLAPIDCLEILVQNLNCFFLLSSVAITIIYRYFFTENLFRLFFSKKVPEMVPVCIRVVDPYSFFPDPDPELDVGGQYGSGSNTDPDPDPIRIQGFNDQKLKKKLQLKFFFLFF